MRRIIDNDYFTMASRLILAAIFILYSYSKIADPGAFAKSIWYYHMVPGVFINLMALILPWLEMLAGLGLLLGVLYRGSVIWINLLLIVFIIALSAAYTQGLDIDCGCYKTSQSAGGHVVEALIRDFGLIILSIQLYLSKSRRWLLCD